MPFHITCVCGRLTVAPDGASGHSIRCSRCDRELEIPSVDAPEPPPVMPPPALVVQDEKPSPRHPLQHRATRGVPLLSAAVASLGLLSVVPVTLAMMHSEPGQAISMRAIQLAEPWAAASLLAAILHFVYMLYLTQLPDWSSVWVVSLFLLLITTLYATVLGIRILASPNNLIMNLLALDGNQFSSNQEAGWCLLMVLLTGTVSYLAGRLGARWYRHSIT